MSKPLAFIDGSGPSEAGACLLAWWRELAEDRGGRAALRRAQSLDDAVLIGAFQRLRRTLLADWSFRPEALADVALATAELDVDGERPGRSLATGNGQGRPISPARLKLIADAEQPEMFLRLLRGALAQVERKGSVLHTAELVRRWRSPASRPAARRRLVLDYFDAAGDDLLRKA